jgi:hypothetical protein
VTTVYALAAGLIACIGLIWHYERDFTALAEWADDLSEENVELREALQRRGSSWS